MSFLEPRALLLLLLLPLLTLPARQILRRLAPAARRLGRVSVGLQFALLGLFVLALSGPSFRGGQGSISNAVVFDASASVESPGLAQSAQLAAAALNSADADERRFLAFGANTVNQDGALDAETILRSVDRRETRAARALRELALGLPGNASGSVALVTDGQTDPQQTIAELLELNRRGFRTALVPTPLPQTGPDTAVLGLSGPLLVEADAPHGLRLTVRNAEAGSVRIDIFRDGKPVRSETRRLEAGLHTLEYSLPGQSGGLVRYRAIVTSQNDPRPGNNSAELAVQVGDPARVLVIGEGEMPWLRALGAQQIEVERVAPADAPRSLQEFLAYESVVLADVPSGELSLQAAEELERYVRDVGGGLVMLGGPNAFGAGGWYGSPVERALPVDMDVTSRLRIPSLAMLFVIDKSGSMANRDASGVSKLDQVKEAVLASIEIMNPLYRVALIAFDANPELVVPPTEAGDRDGIEAELLDLAPGGGTILGPALVEAGVVLAGVDAAVKHIIVLTDGLTVEEDFRAAVDELRGSGVTVSTVAIGDNSDRNLLANVARWGDGRAYVTDSSERIPQIFTAETAIVSQDLVIESPFLPAVETDHPILSGFRESELPGLDGFVLTYPKEEASLVLRGIGGNPLLSAWSYGLGRSVAFTSDLQGLWSTSWLAWDRLGAFLAQALRWAGRPAGSGNTFFRAHEQDGRTDIVVDLFDNGGDTVNLGRLQGVLVDPALERLEVVFRQTAPGRYELSVDTPVSGTWLATISGPDGLVTAPFTVSVSPEFRDYGINPAFFTEISSAGLGEIVRLSELESWFVEVPEQRAPTASPLQERLGLVTWISLGYLLLALGLHYLLLPHLILRRSLTRS